MIIVGIVKHFGSYSFYLKRRGRGEGRGEGRGGKLTNQGTPVSCRGGKIKQRQNGGHTDERKQEDMTRG